MKLFEITPEYLTNYVNFHFTNESWKFDWNEELNIAKLQAEGAAKIYNLLLNHSIALLADEVGMGKTFEALAVMVTLWRQKTNAKILLYAPNEIVALKWINEYHNFIRKNYRENDDLVRSSLNEEALYKAVYCRNHIELMENINKEWVSFYVCKTSSLSGLLSPKMNNNTFNQLDLGLTLEIDESSSLEEETEWMFKLANRCNEKAYEVLSKDGLPPFDLIVFDEAHYLRRTEPMSSSNRGIVAHAFFSGRKIRSENPFDKFRPLASKVLLMTATPSHSSENDIKNIVSLFRPEYYKKLPQEILKNTCVRRFRRLENKIKYEYREEIPEGVQMHSLEEKLFFAAYHKSLVLQKAKAVKEGKVKNNNAYRILFGYLEGFEFIPPENSPESKEDKARLSENKKNSHDNNESINKSDYDTAEDTEVIKKLSGIYKKAYQHSPAHPKYEKIIEELLSSINNNNLIEKKLVFVRRIPSVNEIASRLVEEYDKRFKQELKDIVGARRINKVNLRKFFFNIAKGEAVEDEEDYEKNEKEGDIYGVPKSKVLDLFTVKKSGKYKTTDCSNFRLRFIKNEQIFSVFFQPALDYKQEKYSVDGFIQKSQKDKTRRLYQSTIKTYRKAKILEYNIQIELEPQYNINDIEKEKIKEILEIDTLMGMWYRKDDDTLIDAKKEYDDFSLLEKEGFGNFLEAGVLFSSPYILTFYKYYYKYREIRGEQLYAKFCQKVNNEIDKIGLTQLIEKSVLGFRQFYKKEMGLTEKKLLNEKWNFLKSTLPAYPYNGQTKRPSIVKAFNTPFYPNALIATSVLQEGVDLHYYCSEVIHYGIAWTPGDNEQRNGRVDRLFGKLNHDLKVNPDTVLPIHYPYLVNTIDQEQLQRFIKRKHYAEKLLDKLQTIETSKELTLQEKQDENWESYFNKPTNNGTIEEPYGGHKSDFANVSVKNHIAENKQYYRLKDGLKAVFNTVRKEYGKEVVYYQYNKNGTVNPLVCAIKHIRHNGRHQPLLIELKYFEPGLSWINKPIYLLKIKTPLCGSDKCLSEMGLPERVQEMYQENPILKINYSPNTKGYFRLNVSSELPIFVVKGDSFNLSSDELITAIKNVISFADNLEYSLFDGKNDIKNADVIKTDDSVQTEEIKSDKNDDYLVKDRKPLENHKDWAVNNKGMYYYKIQKDVIPGECKDSYKFNAENNLIRRVKFGNDAYFQVGLYKDDALDEELELMRKIIEITL